MIAVGKDGEGGGRVGRGGGVGRGVNMGRIHGKYKANLIVIKGSL